MGRRPSWGNRRFSVLYGSADDAPPEDEVATARSALCGRAAAAAAAEHEAPRLPSGSERDLLSKMGLGGSSFACGGGSGTVRGAGVSRGGSLAGSFAGTLSLSTCSELAGDTDGAGAVGLAASVTSAASTMIGSPQASARGASCGKQDSVDGGCDPDTGRSSSGVTGSQASEGS